ncbi:MAG: YggS family pyridoxal phosphate-dependent enzyme [Buchananella hordeovulneris]|nr:YggS family pyridoxal phosphate-dependent enzyme [Buchananella hordeovulneris]
MFANSVEEFSTNLNAVRARIEAAARNVGRQGSEIRLLPVSKTVPAARLRLAVAVGMGELAENRVQEVVAKQAELADLGVRWCVIGHLQTNKVRDVAALASEFHALDSLRLAEALERRLETVGRTLDVFLQVNTSGEETKSGVAPADLPRLLDDVAALPHLNVRGLMTIAANSQDEAQVRGNFVLLRSLQEAAVSAGHAGVRELSMGMSADLEWAIAEGATTVRVGRALFGARPQ